MSEAARPALGATQLIGDAFRLLFRNFGTFFPLAFAPALIVEALNIALVSGNRSEAVDLSLSALIAALVGATVGFLVIALLCLATLDALTGRRRELAAYVRSALQHTVPLFVSGAILSVAVAIAMVFLILPGLYVLAQFLVWVQAIVFERAGMGALARAQALTRGYRWPLVGAQLILSLLFFGGAFVTVPVMLAAEADTGRLIAALASAAMAAFLNALAAVFTTLVYLRLREIKEGRSVPEIAAEAA